MGGRDDGEEENVEEDDEGREGASREEDCKDWESSGIGSDDGRKGGAERPEERTSAGLGTGAVR
jgi:hypothetical protein